MLVTQALQENGVNEGAMLDEGDVKGMTQDVMFAGMWLTLSYFRG